MIPWQIEVIFIIVMGFATPFLIMWYATFADEQDTMISMFFVSMGFWAGLYFLAKWWFLWRP
jgi:hypothetical protein